MDISNFRNLVDSGIEDPSFLHQWSMGSFDELSGFGDEIFESFQETKQQLEFNNKRSCEELTGINVDDRLVKQMRTNSFSSCETVATSPDQLHQLPSLHNYFNSNNNQVGGIIVKPKEEIIIMPSNNNNTSFISFPNDHHHHHVVSQAGSYGNYQNNNNYDFKINQGAKRVRQPTASRLPQPQDHILAERRRREKLSQRFIALSALVPGLKKMDKASVLGEAVKYLKQLQEKVKTLEEKTRKKSIESVVVVKGHELYSDGNNSSSCENYPPRFSEIEDSLPEIEVRFSDKDVLIRLHCERKQGVVEKVVSEIEKLHLFIMNSTSMSFCSANDITIIARMNADFSMTMKDFMKNLSAALKTFM
ncbi:basic helix-loop-helix transcription factor [Lithospermum erythrorhizon]|uniref:Basic helix-loop-helix transcription factor n=1 Tax=Lithospermum erythrorhizon TaxID=34254 RepID=A0AAV3PR28_LITER